MGMTALAQDARIAPRIIKISSKRQITIPAEMYERAKFADYAYVALNEGGSLEITPIDVRNESLSVELLRALLAEGFDGEELINEYERIIHPVIDYKAAIERGLVDKEEGRVRPYQQMRDEIRRRYDV